MNKYPHFFPVETSQIPMYNLLGTKEKDKKALYIILVIQYLSTI